jgi:hypothetical protein
MKEAASQAASSRFGCGTLAERLRQHLVPPLCLAEREGAKMLKLIGNVLMWASILIAVSGIACYYWIGTQDMLPVYVAAGIMVLAGVTARYVGANNLRIEINSA